MFSVSSVVNYSSSAPLTFSNFKAVKELNSIFKAKCLNGLLISTLRHVPSTGLPAIALAVLNDEKAILSADKRELINFAYPRAQASRAGTRET